MASTGAKYPTSGASVSESPWSDNAWSTPANIYADDGNTANVTASTFDTGDQTYVLKAQGFDFSSIPDNATIVGVVVRVNAWYRSGQGSGSLDLCQLLDASGNKVGTNQCSTPVALTTDSATIITKGSSSDVWGNALTPSWVKSSNFGVALGIIATANNADVDIDYVTLEIYYTAPITEWLAGTITSVSSLPDTILKRNREILGNSTAISALPDTNLKVLRELIGSLAALSSLPGSTLKRNREISGSLWSLTTLSGILGITTFELLAGTIPAASSLSDAILKRNREIAGSFGASSSLSAATLKRLREIIGSLGGVSGMTGNLSLTKWLEGIMNAQSNIPDATFKRSREIIGSLASTTSSSGNIKLLREFAGSLASQALIDGSAKLSMKLSGPSGGVSSLSSNLKTLRKLNGSLTALSALDAILNVTQPSFVLLDGTIVSQTSLLGAVKLLQKATGSSIAVSNLEGIMKLERRLTGDAQAIALLNGTVVCRCSLSGIIEALTSLTGEFSDISWQPYLQERKIFFVDTKRRDLSFGNERYPFILDTKRRVLNG